MGGYRWRRRWVAPGRLGHVGRTRQTAGVMARLRFFAGLKQAAGIGEVEIPGRSVAEVLSTASATYGSEFERGLATAKVWVNGEPADSETPVSADDEVAVLPPVSGGSSPAADVDAVPSLSAFNESVLLPWIAWGALLVANLVSEELFTIVLVGVVGAWVWDVFDEAAERASGMVRWPALAANLAAAAGAWAWSSEGLGVAVAAGVLLTMSWSVFSPGMRTVEALGGTLLAAVISSVATGSLVLVRLGAHGESRVTSLLIMLIVADLVLWIRLGAGEDSAFDPHTSAAIAALIAGVVTGAVWDTSLVAMVLGAAAVAAAFLAGRAFGSALRTGDLYLLQRLPGFLVPLDGALLAAPLFWVVLALAA